MELKYLTEVLGVRYVVRGDVGPLWSVVVADGLSAAESQLLTRMMQAAGAKDFQVGLAADPRSRFVLEIDATLESSIGGWFRDVNGVMRARLPALALMLPPTSEPTVRITKQKVWSLLKEVV